jgi:hypothetical protein
LLGEVYAEEGSGSVGAVSTECIRETIEDTYHALVLQVHVWVFGTWLYRWIAEYFDGDQTLHA